MRVCHSKVLLGWFRTPASLPHDLSHPIKYACDNVSSSPIGDFRLVGELLVDQNISLYAESMTKPALDGNPKQIVLFARDSVVNGSKNRSLAKLDDNAMPSTSDTSNFLWIFVKTKECWYKSLLFSPWKSSSSRPVWLPIVDKDGTGTDQVDMENMIKWKG